MSCRLLRNRTSNIIKIISIPHPSRETTHQQQRPGNLQQLLRQPRQPAPPWTHCPTIVQVRPNCCLFLSPQTRPTPRRTSRSGASYPISVLPTHTGLLGPVTQSHSSQF